MEKTTGTICIEIQVHCPHCGHGADVWEQVKESVDLGDALPLKDLELVVQCEHCEGEIELTSIEF